MPTESNFPVCGVPLHVKNVLIFLKFSFYKMNIRALLAGFPIYGDKFSNVSNQLMRCFRHEKAVDLYRSKPQSCLTGPL